MMNLGYYNRQIVTTSDKKAMNKHVSVLGDTGSGKTVECQRMVASAVEKGATVIAFDIHKVLAEDQIFSKYKSTFEQYTHNIDVHADGIHCDLFTPITYGDGTKESGIDVVGSITTVLSEVIHAGSVQKSDLRKAVQQVYDNESYKKSGIMALAHALEESESKRAAILCDKLYFLTAHNIFKSGETFYERNKINIFRLSRFDLESQVLISEMILAYLWRLANAGQFKNDPIYVWIDEYQNLPSGKTSMIAQILAEGRRMGLHLILATQMQYQGNVSVVQQRVSQCGLKLYFRPASGQECKIAKLLDPARERDWVKVLQTLEIGEFIADGKLVVGGKETCGPLKITARE